MDLNTPQNLDPKLKEAYERMMGQKPQTPIVKSQEPETLPPKEEPPEPTEAAHDAYGSVIEKPQASQPTPAFEEMPQESHGLLFALIGIGAIIFLIGYSIVWAKILNLI